MIDVFIRTMGGKDKLRQAFFDATMARWEMEPVEIHVLTDFDYRKARFVAEDMAQSEIYIFADDDCVVWGKDWTATGLRAMQKNSEYGACSTKSKIVTESPFDTRENECDIFPVPSVGSPLWMRKGIIKDEDFPQYEYVSECGELCVYLQRKGWKEGIINGIAHVHLGHGFSTDPRWVVGY